MLDWIKLDREKWDRAVEVLLFRHYSDPDLDVYIYDGSGGDGGRDIEVVSRATGYRIILQLKHFPEGFSSVWGQRRKQIKKSFKAALKQRPDEWILVVPKNLTAGERTYINRLAVLMPEGEVPAIGEFTQTWLDSELARHPDLEDALNRNEWERMAEMLKDVHRLPPATPDDVAAEVAELQRRIDAVDPYWTLDVTTVEGRIVQTPRPKDPSSPALNPLFLEIQADEEQLSPEHRHRIRAMFGFGLDGVVDLPPEAISRIELRGSPLVARTVEHPQLTLITPRGMPRTDACEIELWRNDEQVCGYVAKVVHHDSGSLGNSLRMRIADVLEITLLVPEDTSAPCEMELEYDASSTTPPAAVAEALGFWIQLADGYDLHLLAEGNRFAILSGTLGLPAEDLERMRSTQSLASDLDTVGRAVSRSFLVPGTYTMHDRATLRATRLLLEGHRTQYPGITRLPLTVDPSAGIEDADRLLRGEVSAVRTTVARFNVELFGRKFTLPNVWMAHEQTMLMNRDEVMAELTQHPDRPVGGVLARQGGGCFTAVMGSAVVDPETMPASVWWGVPELEEYEMQGRPLLDPAAPCTEPSVGDPAGPPGTSTVG